MNRHIAFDKIMLWVFRTFGRPFFEASIQSPDFDTHLRNVSFENKRLMAEGIEEFTVRSLGATVGLRVRILNDCDPTAPLVIYNMGGGEAPFYSTANRMYAELPDYNVVVVEAPYQRDKQQLEASFSELNNYIAMLAMTVKMNEHILQSSQFKDASIRLIAGTSLGGFVTNRHHLTYNTANVYAPFVAGTRHGDIFLTSMPASIPVQNDPQKLQDLLNFEESWKAKSHENVFPQLSRFDQLNKLELQAPSYGAVPIDIWEGGHMYNVIHADKTRNKLESLLTEPK